MSEYDKAALLAEIVELTTSTEPPLLQIPPPCTLV